MPPKGNQKVDKTKIAAKQKAAEDKTFGLKNKNKSVKVQQYVNNVTKNASQAAGRKVDAFGLPIEPTRERRKKEDDAAKELNSLFTVAIKQPKVPEGVDPKSIVCEFFRHGQCTKGAKCKFSHDLNVERKSHKIDMFTDQRAVGAAEEDDENGMDDWDQEMLERAIKEKHSNENKPTQIICKFFLDAVEKRLYGWFWKCPNGTDCKYRHALPSGYVLKSQMKELLEEERRNTKDASEMIEEERSKLHARTPINETVFRAWHKARAEAKRKAREEADAERRKKGVLNGREIFQQDGYTYEDDAAATDDFTREDDEEARIREMLESAQRAAAEARDRAAEARENGEVMLPVVVEDEDDVYAQYAQEDGEDGEEGEDEGQGSGDAADAQGSGGASSSEGMQQQQGKERAVVGPAGLSREEGEALFGGEDDDDDDDLELDDDDEEDLEALEQHVKQLHT